MLFKLETEGRDANLDAEDLLEDDEGIVEEMELPEEDAEIELEMDAEVEVTVDRLAFDTDVSVLGLDDTLPEVTRLEADAEEKVEDVADGPEKEEAIDFGLTGTVV